MFPNGQCYFKAVILHTCRVEDTGKWFTVFYIFHRLKQNIVPGACHLVGIVDPKMQLRKGQGIRTTGPRGSPVGNPKMLQWDNGAGRQNTGGGKFFRIEHGQFHGAPTAHRQASNIGFSGVLRQGWEKTVDSFRQFVYDIFLIIRTIGHFQPTARSSGGQYNRNPLPLYISFNSRLVQPFIAAAAAAMQQVKDGNVFCSAIRQDYIYLAFSAGCFRKCKKFS